MIDILLISGAIVGALSIVSWFIIIFAAVKWKEEPDTSKQSSIEHYRKYLAKDPNCWTCRRGRKYDTEGRVEEQSGIFQ